MLIKFHAFWKEEERFGNSEKFDFIFEIASYFLAPDIFSLYKWYAHLTVNERAKVKEKINPDLRYVTQVWNRLLFVVGSIYK